MIYEDDKLKRDSNALYTLLECVICENCNKKTIKEKAMKVPECYFKGNKIFYVCNEDCLKEFLGVFR